MHDFILIGTAVGLMIGLMHTAYLTRVVASGGETGTKASWISVLNFAGWTLLLWLLMGAYVVGFWLVGFAFYLIFKAFR